MDLPTDTVLADRYRIVERRGRGGMAVVYEAHDEVLDRRVALKVLADHLLDDPRAVGRFEREARAAAGLNHPNVVGVHDAASDDGTHFLVMELIDGTTLSERLQADGPLDVDEALALADQVAAALAAAHAAGMVHRDVKPSNILLTGGGGVKVADFGIARAVASAATQTAVVMGSVPYVAPEQLDGSTGPDPRSDLYALGCVLFECLTGRPPFVADTSAAVLGQHLHLTPPPVSTRRSEVGGGVDELVAGLLAKDPDDRPASADDLRERLSRLRAGGPGGGAAAGAAGAAAAAAAGDDLRGAPTEQLDDGRQDPTEVVAGADRTEVLPGAAGAVTGGAGVGGGSAVGDGSTAGPGGTAPDGGPSRPVGRWLLVALVLVLLAAGIWALASRDDTPGETTTDLPTATEDTATETDPEDTTTETDPGADPTDTGPGETEPTGDPTTPTEQAPTPTPTEAPSPTPSPSPPPSPTPTPSPPAATTDPTTSPTAQALADVRELVDRGRDNDQLSGDAARAIDGRLDEVEARLAEVRRDDGGDDGDDADDGGDGGNGDDGGDGDDAMEAVRQHIEQAREEVTQQVEQDEAVPGIANQLDAALADVEATLP